MVLMSFLCFAPISAHGETKTEQSNTSNKAFKYKAIPLNYLPRDRYGMVDWVKSVDEGILEPLASLDESFEEPPPLDLTITIKSKKNFMPDVRFPHKAHTYWLNCEVCHPQIFPMKKGGVPEMTMWDILRGEYCGRCHGKVAFPLRECYRCHIKREKSAAKKAEENLKEKIAAKPKLSIVTPPKQPTTPVALTVLPRDRYNLVDWAEAVRQGILAPLASLDGSDEDEEIIDLLVLIKSKKDFMPDVIFPHSTHTYWLNCEVCHPQIFPMKKGGVPEMTMWDILDGEYCGRCHNRVAFPIRECYRCHIKKDRKNKKNKAAQVKETSNK